MATCFVIQPFDAGRFDKRFEQVFTPAIKAASLEAYRVDKDLKADVPIEAIENGIKSAAVCLADITTDNPNVWYELGYAFACGIPVVMVCSEPREGKKYPFDIQHRTVIPYTAEAPGDFIDLQQNITDRLLATVEGKASLRRVASSEQIAPLAGLTHSELTVLAALASNVELPKLKSAFIPCNRIAREPV